MSRNAWGTQHALGPFFRSPSLTLSAMDPTHMIYRRSNGTPEILFPLRGTGGLPTLSRVCGAWGWPCIKRPWPRVCCGALSVLRLEADGLHLLHRHGAFKKKGMKRKRNAEKCVSAFAERCLPNQFKMLSAQRPSHHGFSLTSEAGLLFKGLFSLMARRGLGPLQQLPVVPGSQSVRCPHTDS